MIGFRLGTTCAFLSRWNEILGIGVVTIVDNEKFREVVFARKVFLIVFKSRALVGV